MIKTGMQHIVCKEGGDIEKEAEDILLVARAAVDVWSAQVTERDECTRTNAFYPDGHTHGQIERNTNQPLADPHLCLRWLCQRCRFI